MHATNEQTSGSGRQSRAKKLNAPVLTAPASAARMTGHSPVPSQLAFTAMSLSLLPVRQDPGIDE